MPSATAACACTSWPMSMATTSRRCCANCGPKARCSWWPARPSLRRRPWPMRRWRRPGSWAPAAPTWRATSWPPPPTCRRRRPSASKPASASGTGWAGAIRCGAPSGCPSRWPSARRTSAPCWPVPMPWTGTSPPRRWNATCRCCWGCWTSGTATSTATAAARWRPTTRACGGCRPTCSNWRWNPTASAWTWRGARCPSAPARWCGASPAPTASMPISRCCTRAPT